MKINRTTITAVVFYSIFFISCQESKKKEEQTIEPEVAEETKAETVLNDTTDANKISNAEAQSYSVNLNDTIGVYKINNAEAQAYILKMYTLLFKLETAMNNNALDRMPALMQEINQNLKKQTTVQSGLSEADRILFKPHMIKIADKLLAIADRMGKM